MTRATLFALVVLFTAAVSDATDIPQTRDGTKAGVITLPTCAGTGKALTHDPVATPPFNCNTISTEGGTPSGTVAALDGSGAAGVSAEYARGDHKHGDVNRPTDGQAAALAGTSGTPGDANRYVTNGDARLSDARTPTSHTHPQTEVTDLTTDLSAKESTANKGAASGYAALDSGTRVPVAQLPAATTTAQGVVELATDGESAASLAVQANDARLSNARTPTAHATAHESGGGDVLTGTLDANARVLVRKNTGVDVGTRRRLNLIEGTNVTLTVTDDAPGEEVDITIAAAGGSGAPTDATYWTGSANGTLSAEHNLGALGTGLVVNTSGTPSAYAGTSCTNQFPRSLNASGAATCADVAAGDFASQTANAVLAGPASGGAADPSFRALVSDDVPALDAAKITTGTVATARLGSGTANSTTFLRGDQTWAAPSGGADPWTYLVVNGGADFTTTSNTAQDVTGLSLTPSASTKYEFECMLLLRTATATVQPRVGFAWSTGLTDGVAQIMESQAATGTPLFASGNPNAALLVAVGGLPNTTQSWPARITASFVAGATPSGTTRVQLASETSGTTVTVKTVGSFCRYRTY